MIVDEQRELLGTQIEIKVPEHHAPFFSNCFSEIERIEQTYSRFLDNSELAQINSNLHRWQPVSEECLYLVERALQFNKNTGGKFDITLKQTLEDLGYDKNYSMEEKQRKKTVTERVTEQLLEPIKIDTKHAKIFLRKEIEFGGLGKGFALDAVSALLDKNKVDHYYINAGGDIFSKRSPERKPWDILLEHPDTPEKTIGKIELDQHALASSSPNRRSWKGKHHLLDPQSKKPASSIKAVFVQAKTGIEADAYATALVAAGFGESLALAKKLPLKTLIISDENKMYNTLPVTFFD